MTLHEETVQILKEKGNPLSTSEISDLVNQRKNYKKKDGSSVSSFQIHGRTRNYSNLFLRNKYIVGLKGRDESVIDNVKRDNPTGGDYRVQNPDIYNISNSTLMQTEYSNVQVHKTEYLTNSGFTNIGTVLQISSSGFTAVPELSYCGVYAITKPENYDPSYFSVEEAKLNGNVIRPWDLDKLSKKWVDDADILYYGLAGANSFRSLKSRLKDLINHSKSLVTDRGPHKGGEIIWQLKGYENFSIWILPTGNPPAPREMEAKLLKSFYQLTGKLPFANRRF